MSNVSRGIPSGFTLIEVLVSLLIFSVGLLGCAGLQGRAQQAQQEAYQRAYAINMMTDMLGLIRANNDARGCYQLANIELGVGYSQTYQCTGHGKEEGQQRAAEDINQWSDQLQGMGTVNDGGNVGGLLNARGCIEFDGALNRYVVSVVWQGLVESGTSNASCGEGLYGGTGNSLRRLVSGTFVAPNLDG